jgi:hypothetical protein
VERLHRAQRERRRVALGGADVRTHLPQRPDHPTHRPARQGLVADQGHTEPLPGHQARQQPHAGAGVAHVERTHGGREAVQADAAHREHAVVRAVDGDAHGTKRRRRRQRVGAGQKSLETALAVGQRRQHHGAVRDRFIAGDAAGTGDASAR